MNGVITDAYFAPEADVSNPWVQVEKKLLQDYAPALYAKSGLDGNTQYGIALAYTFVQALQAAGKNLTRAGLLAAIASSGKNFVTPGFVPLSYSSHGALRLRGIRGHQAQQHCTTGGDTHGKLDRQHAGLSGAGDQRGIGSGHQVHGPDLHTAHEPGVDVLTDDTRELTVRAGQIRRRGQPASAVGASCAVPPPARGSRRTRTGGRLTTRPLGAG